MMMHDLCVYNLLWN